MARVNPGLQMAAAAPGTDLALKCCQNCVFLRENSGVLLKNLSIQPDLPHLFVGMEGLFSANSQAPPAFAGLQDDFFLRSRLADLLTRPLPPRTIK
jgi:hypothetical protein